MDCRTARMLLAFHRPGASELEPADVQGLSSHLENCGVCREQADEERRADASLGLAMHQVAIPPGLRDRILTRLSNERNAYYRGWLFRGSVAAAAAAVLIAVGVYLRVRSMEKETPRLNIDSIISGLQTSDPLPKSADDVQSYYTKRGIALQIPDEMKQWDFEALRNSYISYQQGQPVPTLVFEKGTSRAVVLLLHRSQYHATSVPGTDQSFQRVRVLGKPGDSEYIALVIVQEGKYEDFLKAKPPTSA